MLEKMKLNGQVVVVTGAGAGIGRATCVALAELGATVGIVGRSLGNLEGTQELVKAHGVDSQCFVVDVAMEEQVNKLCEDVIAKWGGAKSIVNNVGDNFRASITELSTEKWHQMMAVDIDSVFYMCRAFIPHLLKADQPSILNMASSYGLVGRPMMPIYCTAKGAMINMTRQLAVEFGGKGLRVNSLCPGPTLSPRMQGYIDSGQTDGARLAASTMLNRFATNEEIGDVAAFLVTDAASYVHGATIVADGGQTIH